MSPCIRKHALDPHNNARYRAEEVPFLLIRLIRAGWEIIFFRGIMVINQVKEEDN